MKQTDILFQLNSESEIVFGNIQLTDAQFNQVNKYVNDYYKKHNCLPHIEVSYSFIPETTKTKTKETGMQIISLNFME